MMKKRRTRRTLVLLRPECLIEEEEEEDIVWKIMMRRRMRLFPCDVSGAARRPLRHLGQVRDARAARWAPRALPDKKQANQLLSPDKP